jgi:hypothetical protein
LEKALSLIGSLQQDRPPDAAKRNDSDIVTGVPWQSHRASIELYDRHNASRGGIGAVFFGGGLVGVIDAVWIGMEFTVGDSMFACKLIGDASLVGPALAGKAAYLASKMHWMYQPLPG